jgi:hypothetical protein
LRLVFNAFALEGRIFHEEVAMRGRFRRTQLRNLGRRVSALDAERTNLYMQLVLRGWQNVIDFRNQSSTTILHPLQFSLVRCRKPGVIAVSLLERAGWKSLAQQCILSWRNFVAEGLAMQVILMRERLQRADSECCVLRGEDERLRAEAERCKALLGEAELRSATAEQELYKRSREEFSQLREMQIELAKLRSKSVASTAPTFNLDPICATTYLIGSAVVASAKTPQAIATVTGGMVASFTMSSVRAWMKLYLLSWRSLAANQELVLALAAQASAVDACLCASRIFSMWRWNVPRARAHQAKLRIGEIMQKQYVFSLAHAILRAWHSNIDRISCLVTPLSLRDSIAVSPSPTMLDSTAQYYSAVAKGTSTPFGERNRAQDAKVVPVQLWPSASPAQSVGASGLSSSLVKAESQMC